MFRECKSGFRTSAISEMVLFVKIFSCENLLSIAIRGSILDVAGILDTPPEIKVLLTFDDFGAFTLLNKVFFYKTIRNDLSS